MCSLWPSSVQVQLYSNQACHRAGLGKGKGEGTSTNIWSIVTQWSSLRTLPRQCDRIALMQVLGFP